MPSPRAVLHDLAHHGLDPAKPHARIATNGHLAGHAVSTPTVEPQLALKKLPVEEPKVETKPEKKAEPVKVEAPKQEEKAPEAPKKEAKKAAKAAEKVAEEKKVEEKPAAEEPKVEAEEKPAS